LISSLRPTDKKNNPERLNTKNKGAQYEGVTLNIQVE
jgi:hypothetical protein